MTAKINTAERGRPIEQGFGGVHDAVGIFNPEVSVPLSNLVDGWFVALSLHSILMVW